MPPASPCPGSASLALLSLVLALGCGAGADASEPAHGGAGIETSSGDAGAGTDPDASSEPSSTAASTAAASDTGADTETTDTVEVEIIFPPPSATIADALPVRGRARAASAILAVRVAGVAATSADGFATWRAEIPLVPGANTIGVDVETEHGITADAASVEVTRAADWGSLSRGDTNRFGEVFDGLYAGAENIEFDPISRKVWVVDNWGDGVYTIDVDSGDHSTVSYSELGKLMRGTGPELTAPDEGALFADLGVFLVTDTIDPSCEGCSGLFAIDVDSGDRRVLVDLAAAGIRASDIAVDPSTGQAIVVSYDDGTVWRVDPSDGTPTPLGSGDQRVSLRFPVSFAVDLERGRMIVVEQYRGEFATVDLATGAIGTFSPEGSAGPAFDDASRITVSTDEDELYVFEGDGGASPRLLAVDLESGERRELPISAADGMSPVPLTGLATHEHGILAMTGYALFVLDPIEAVKVVVSK